MEPSFLAPGVNQETNQKAVEAKKDQLNECCKDLNNHVVYNHSPIWHDGDIHCRVCGKFIRYYDAG